MLRSLLDLARKSPMCLNGFDNSFILLIKHYRFHFFMCVFICLSIDVCACLFNTKLSLL